MQDFNSCVKNPQLKRDILRLNTRLIPFHVISQARLSGLMRRAKLLYFQTLQFVFLFIYQTVLSGRQCLIQGLADDYTISFFMGTPWLGEAQTMGCE